MIYLVLIFHWIADFIFQTDSMAKNKSSSMCWLSRHIVVYTAIMMVFGPKFAVANGASHLVIDYFTSKASKYFYNKNEIHNFFVVIGFDQLLHVCILIYTMPLIAWSL